MVNVDETERGATTLWSPRPRFVMCSQDAHFGHAQYFCADESGLVVVVAAGAGAGVSRSPEVWPVGARVCAGMG